jgi:prepilin-type processing-associated H-X9-DG protein
MMPALHRARNQARRVTSAANLKQIGVALVLYANDHDGEFPTDLKNQDFLRYLRDSASKVLESPLKPKEFDGPSYIYIAGQSAESPSNNILAYENPAFCREGLNVLFVDSHVRWMKPDEFLRELEATYNRLGREMPEIRFKGSKGPEPKQSEPIPMPTEK